MKVGDNEVKDILIGDTQVLKVYRGEDVIWERGGLPSGYTEVKYLESTGTQWIDTGLRISKNDIITIEWLFTGVPYDNTNNYIFGGRDSATLNNLQFTKANNGVLTCDYGNYQINRIFLPIVVQNQWYETIINSEYISLNGTHYAFNYVDDFLTPSTYLFNMNTTFTGVPFKGKIRKFEVESRADYIPCLDNNSVPCFYDTVSGNTFYNSGTGTFGYETMDGTVVSPT